MLLIGLSSFVSFFAPTGTTRYVATNGNDVSGNGSVGLPYKTIGKAASVAVITDVIHIKAGTYVEPAIQAIVPVGVSVEGEGQGITNVTLTYSITGSNGFNMAAIQFVSTTPNTNGNQTISNISFSGNNYQCFSGILVHARGGVTIQNCTFSKFGITAVNLNGKTGQNTGTDPVAFADGNQIRNCTFLDNNDRILQQANSVSCGSVSIAGQTNLLMQDDTLRNINNKQGHNGDLVGGIQGNNKSCRFINSIFEKPEDEGASYNFCFEMWYSKGNMEIAGCTFIGGGNHIDHGYGDLYKGAFSYSWYEHDNTHTNPRLMASAQNLPNVTAGGFVTGKAYMIKSLGTTNFTLIGAASNATGIIFTATGPGTGTGTGNASHPTESIAIQFEPATNTALKPINPTIGDAIIQNIHLKNIGCFIQATLNNNSADFISNMQIDHIDGQNMGFTNSTYSAAFNLTISNGLSMHDWHMTNITMVSAAGPGCLKAIWAYQPDAVGSTMYNIDMINCIADGCATGYGYIIFRGLRICDNFKSKCNIIFGNAFNDNPFVFTSPAAPQPTNFQDSGNIKLDPLFVSASDQHLSAKSPGISAGFSPIASYIGAFPVTSSNIAPTVDAGPDKTIQLLTNFVNLSGSATDPDGTIVSYAWTKVSGGTANISSPNSASTNITGLAQGTYQFKLTATDNGGLTGSDIVVVTVLPANIAPTANAGTDQTIQLPTSSTTLTGSGSDPDGSITAYGWTLISGPNTPTIVSAASATTSVTGLINGTYQFQLRVTDNQGLSGTDIIQVIVSASANVAPTADAGVDQTIQLPTSSVTLTGSGTDPDGTIVTYTWTKITGSGTITSPASATTTVTGLGQGISQFKLTVTDNGGLTGSDNMIVTVTAANVPPIINAGTDQSITSPTSSITFAGSATDPDGSISSHTWTKTSGTGGTITTPSSYTSTVTGLTPGTYVFRLTGTDNQSLTGFDEMTVTVNAANPVAPVAHAGSDQTITWPVNSVTLSGSGTDADGTIVGYNWRSLDGTGTITNNAAASTTVTNLTVGVHQFQLTVIDNNGLTAKDTMRVTVNKGNLTINVTGTSVIFNSANQLPTVTTTPAGISYSITLNGLAGGQSQVGTYNYFVGATDPNWNFTPATGTFTITKATAVISATSQTFNYDGLTHSIPGTVSPNVGVLSYTYDGSPTPPSAIGVYDEAITLTNANYQATTIHVTLTIVSNSAIIFISDTDFVYDGTAKNVTVTSLYSHTTVYSPGTHVNAGTYQVITTINDGIHTGADTAILTIHPKPAVLSWAQPAAQPLGFILNSGILDAQADVLGSWSYDHAIGESLPLGTTRITGTFTPSSGNYSGGTISVDINVYGTGNQFQNFYIIGPDGVIYIEQ